MVKMLALTAMKAGLVFVSAMVQLGYSTATADTNAFTFTIVASNFEGKWYINVSLV